MKEKIMEILTDVNDEIESYDGDNMLEDGQITSLDIIDIVSALEEEFGITISAKHITKENLANVDSICALVEKLKQG